MRGNRSRSLPRRLRGMLSGEPQQIMKGFPPPLGARADPSRGRLRVARGLAAALHERVAQGTLERRTWSLSIGNRA